MGILDTITVTISVNELELLALKKLSLVSHALAQKLNSAEQKCLADTLDDMVRRIELAAAGAPAGRAP